MFGKQREERGISIENNHRHKHSLSCRKGIWGQKQSLYIPVSYMRGRKRGNQDIWRKRKDGIIKSKFLYLNGITSALSAVRVEKTNLAGRETPKTLGMWTPSQCPAITKTIINLHGKMELIPWESVLKTEWYGTISLLTRQEKELTTLKKQD